MAKLPLKKFNVRSGQIYRTLVEYVDQQGRKERPVIIVTVDEEEFLALSLKITKTGIDSQKNRSWDKYKTHLLNWRRAGLTHPSYVECSHVVEIESDTLVEYLGEMHQLDFERVISEFNRYIEESSKASTHQ